MVSSDLVAKIHGLCSQNIDALNDILLISFSAYPLDLTMVGNGLDLRPPKSVQNYLVCSQNIPVLSFTDLRHRRQFFLSNFSCNIFGIFISVFKEISSYVIIRIFSVFCQCSKQDVNIFGAKILSGLPCLSGSQIVLPMFQTRCS